MNNRNCLWGLVALALVLSACADDGNKNNFQQQADADMGDMSGDGTSDGWNPPDGGDMAIDMAIPEDFLVEEEVVEPMESDYACNVDERVAACQSALLDDGAMPPADPAELLYYVNRWNSIPPEFPISAMSSWIPCYGGDPGVMHDLICVPAAYISGNQQALRQVAWESDAPTAMGSTHDSLPVGFMGKVGYRAMFDAAIAEAGYELFVASGFRSYATQLATFNSHKQREINGGLSDAEAELVASTYSAQPGHSEHQLGTTADLTFRQPNGIIFPGLNRSMAQAAPIQWVHQNAHRFGIVLTYGEDKIEATQYIYEPWHHRFVGVEAADDMRECQLNTEEFLATRYGFGALPEYAGNSLILYLESDMREHITYGPGGWVRPNEVFTKTWAVKNTGTINWHGYTLERVSGSGFTAATIDVTCVPAGQLVALSVEMTAPAVEGTYDEVWRVIDDTGQPFGDDLVVRLVVSNTQPQADPYYYVRVDDLSMATGGADPGADLDAIVLTKSSGSTVFAQQVESYVSSPSDVSANNPAEILGAPDAFQNWPDVTTCRVDGGFVSLGGGGTIIVRMGDTIEQADVLDVLEIGGCEYSPGQSAIPDRVDVLVSVSADMGGQWIPIGAGSGPQIGFTVPELPPLTAP